MTAPIRKSESSPRRKRLAILGATGSIGLSTLDVVERHPDRYAVHALTAHKSESKLLELCLRFRPEIAVLSGAQDAPVMQSELRKAGCSTTLLFGASSLVDAVEGCDAVMAAIVGAAGLAPTLRTAQLGKQVMLANKEALVMAGPVFMRYVRQSAACLLPIDSEHNAVFQCMPSGRDGRTDTTFVSRIMLTASGGPFRSLPIDRFEHVTPEQACAHPNWSMGRKISVDSATMMNKGLEVIEACLLFGVPPERVQVLIHPQSIIHSMVEYLDGSVLAQLSNPDMRIPIAHALAFPERTTSGVTPLDLAAIGTLQFEAPDMRRFPCLGLAFQALKASGTAPAILNASNEIAVEAFLAGSVPFTAIHSIVEGALNALGTSGAETLEEIIRADALAREVSAKLVARAAEGAR